MSRGLQAVRMAAAVLEARAHLNEMHAIHGPDSLLTETATAALRYTQQAATDFMSADD